MTMYFFGLGPSSQKKKKKKGFLLFLKQTSFFSIETLSDANYEIQKSKYNEEFLQNTANQ